MANPKHVAKLKKGVEAWNTWRQQYPNTKPNLSRANLEKTRLNGADLSEANLNDADLTEADLGEADLSEAHLSGARLLLAELSEADLSGADLRRADLYGSKLFAAQFFRANLSGANVAYTDLKRANLKQARLIGAELNGANLESALPAGLDLTDATVGFTIFARTDLSGVKGLDTVRHSGPSTIGIDTIFLSKGNIPEVFLRGAGVPDNFIEYMRSLAANPIEYYSCFISYSTKDQGFADRLHSDLQGKGVRCWFAPQDMQGGKKAHEQIDDAIRRYDKLLLILSAHSMNSEWVKTEIAKARRREKQENRRMLFPVSLVPFKTLEDWECFDADMGKASAREVREYYVPDFTHWENQKSFKEGFDRLLRDLKAETLKKS